MRLRRLTPAMILIGTWLTSMLTGSVAAHAATQICDQYGSTTAGSYVVMNNRWGSSAQQCIDVSANGFTITSQQGSTSGGAPLSYPAIYLGCHYGNCSPGTPLPRQLSAIGSAPSSISYSYAPGVFDASYDIWMDPTAKTTGVNQMELMIWFNQTGGVHPVGSQVGNVNIGGVGWQVWQGNNGGNDVVSYVATSPLSGWSFDVMAFVRELQTRTRVTNSWYLTSIQAGFEPWSGGTGLSVNSFSAAVNGGGSGGGGGTGGQQLVGQGSGRCLDLNAFGTADGTVVQLWDCTGNWNQKWSQNGAALVNPQSGKCLDVNGGGTANGTTVQLWTCNGTGAQNWQFRSNGTVVNPQSGRCLDASGMGTANGTRVQIWDCYGGGGTQSNQVWTLR